MSIKLAFVGFRHGHILALHKHAQEMDNIEIVATCEEDQTTRDELISKGTVKITHSNFDDMLSSVKCDVIAVGDYYAKRGSLIIKALSQNKHVISDKPMCTSLSELDEIQKLSQVNNLKVGCMLDLRNAPQFIGVKELIGRGKIGEIHAISFGGQHPLMLGQRPSWYFEPGKHGGTINDIAIHAINGIPWLTGLRFTVVNAARCWNAFASDFPHFKDAGQMMLTMENGCGVLGDVSYFIPDSFGYSLPLYWRMTFFGRQGIIETSSTAKETTLAINGKKELSFEPLPNGRPGGYLQSFINDINGNLGDDDLNTQNILESSRITLVVQKSAEDNTREIRL